MNDKEFAKKTQEFQEIQKELTRALQNTGEKLRSLIPKLKPHKIKSLHIFHMSFLLFM